MQLPVSPGTRSAIVLLMAEIIYEPDFVSEENFAGIGIPREIQFLHLYTQ